MELEKFVFKGKSLYSEPLEASREYRLEYLASVKRLISRWRSEAAEKRDEYIPPEKLAADRESYRRDYVRMLGRPLTDYGPGMPVPKVKEEFVARDDQADIYRLTIEVMEDFNFYGLLLLPLGIAPGEKRPLVIAQHGGGGTPELCCDINGTNNYGHLARRHLERGAVVFAPQLLLWNAGAVAGGGGIPSYGDPHERQKRDLELKQLGGSITALEIFCHRRSIDYLVTRPEIDSEAIGMNGLSYGGFYSLVTPAAETRIKSAYSCAFFNDRFVYSWSDFVWSNSGNTFLDSEIAGLIAPRKLWIEVGTQDGSFDYRSAEREGERLPRYFEAAGVPENVVLKVWDGGHRMTPTDEGLDFIYEAFKKRPLTV